MNEAFRKFAHKTSEIAGSPWAFITAVTLILVWALSGPIFGFADTWQLLANTVTTLITTLMVFLIQNTQNRDAKAVHLKLDELLRAVSNARTGMVDLEDMTDEELKQLQKEFEHLRQDHSDEIRQVPEAIEDELEERKAEPAR